MRYGRIDGRKERGGFAKGVRAEGHCLCILVLFRRNAQQSATASVVRETVRPLTRPTDATNEAGHSPTRNQRQPSLLSPTKRTCRCRHKHTSQPEHPARAVQKFTDTGERRDARRPTMRHTNVGRRVEGQRSGLRLQFAVTTCFQLTILDALGGGVSHLRTMLRNNCMDADYG